MRYDIVLSSGYLAFARQVGFLLAIEESGLQVEGLCGTSSGALVGALWASGMPARTIGEELKARPPLGWARPHRRVWRGALSLGPAIARLRSLLPARFEDLPIAFGAGVMAPGRRAALLTSGPLPEAVAASCAIPHLFAPVRVGEAWLQDGGIVNRTALPDWRAHRGARPTLLHLVDASSAGHAPTFPDVAVVRTPRAVARLWNLGAFDEQAEQARQRAHAVIAALPRQAVSA